MARAGRSAATRSRASRFFLPRPHRLFVVFDDGAAAHAAIEALGPQGQGSWFFEGPDGAAELDPVQPGSSRLFSWVFSHNVEYLESLSQTVATGKSVVGVPARTLQVADDLAGKLRHAGGRPLAYTAHWNFVPLSA